MDSEDIDAVPGPLARLLEAALFLTLVLILAGFLSPAPVLSLAVQSEALFLGLVLHVVVSIYDGRVRVVADAHLEQPRRLSRR